MREILVRCLWASASLVFTCLVLNGALRAEQDAPVSLQQDRCRVERMKPTGMLLSCGTHLLSLNLTMDDISRKVYFSSDGLFHFDCPIEEMCKDQPHIAGWMILKEAWQMSRQDEEAIYQMLMLPPAVKGPQPRTEDLLPKVANSTCGTFKINVANMDGRAACYDEANTTVIAVVASGEAFGFALLFSQNNIDLGSLRDRVNRLAPTFRIERAQGDINLMQWIP